MKFYLPKDLIISDSNIAYNEDENGNLYTEYNKMSGYNKGLQVYYNWNLYTSLTTIYPMVNYIWEDLIVADKYAYDVLNEIRFATPSAVPCLSGVTVVYVRSLDSYYKAKTTGNINFTIEDPVTHANFDKIVTPIIPYNYDFTKPSGAENTIYWSYDGVANRQRAFDSALNTQTNYEDELYFKFTNPIIDAISFFNLSSKTVRIKVTDTATATILYDETTNTLDTSHIINYTTYCTSRAIQKDNIIAQKIPTRYGADVEVWIDNSSSIAKIGTIKAGILDYLGKTQDGVDVTNKSYNEISQRSNGEYVWNIDNVDLNKSLSFSYNIVIETFSFDSMMTKLKSITDKEVVLIGDDTDDVFFSSLINYGAITASNGYLKSNDTYSTLSISVENFV